MGNSNRLSSLAPLSIELASANLGDKRRVRRLGKIVDLLSPRPSESFPQAMGSQAALEGAYRFLRNPDVNCEKILEPHLQATIQRAVESKNVLLIHDTTEFIFAGERQDLGRIDRPSRQGFLGHFALAVTDDANHVPLGIAGLQTIFRTGKSKGRRSRSKENSDLNNESLRWRKLVEQVEQRVAGQASIVHVMDREADSYILFGGMVCANHRFVIRLCQNRVLYSSKEEPSTWPKLFDALNGAETVLEREVFVSRRPLQEQPKQRKRHPARESRIAKLAFSTARVKIKRPGYVDRNLPDFVELNIIRVFEVDPPAGAEPIEWKLLSTEPINTAEEVAIIVDIYRARWMVEEYFKALKSGCGYGKRQLDSKHTLLNALAIFVPVAWRLLLLRSLSRSHPETPAEAVLSQPQIAILRSKSTKPLPDMLCAQQAMLAIAALGGHITNNGMPGWQVLGRGWETLLLLEQGWKIAREKM